MSNLHVYMSFFAFWGIISVRYILNVTCIVFKQNAKKKNSKNESRLSHFAKQSLFILKYLG